MTENSRILPEEVYEFFIKNDILPDLTNNTLTDELLLDNLTTYDVQDNIVYTGTIVDKDGVYLQWEPSKLYDFDNYLIFGSYIDSL